MILSTLLHYPWVRTALAVAFDLWALATIFANAMRAIPEERFVRFERAYPRWGHGARAARKFGSDFIPFLQSVAAAFQGLPVARAETTPPPPASGQSGRSTVGAILVVALAAVVTLLVALGLAVSGCDPSQHDPTLPPVRVYVSADWSPTDRARIGDELVALRALGPSFYVTDLSDQADVIVRPWESPDCTTAGAGGHTLGTRVAEVDPTCAPGDAAFRAMVGHEVGHALGLMHVCTVHETGADCSPSVRGSPAMMARSPFVDSHDPVIGLVAVDTPQALDLQEYSRVRGGR